MGPACRWSSAFRLRRSASPIGLALGVVAGYFRWLDGVVMRFMDGLMAIPAILMAIVLISLAGSGLITVIIAITIPQVPTVVRLVRSIVLMIREEPYVEAAVSVGTPTAKVLWRHVLPNTFAPLIVQATFLCGSAILLEAILSFLGVGMPSDAPTWGNIMADGRSLFQIYPHMILFPGVFLAVTVLGINMLGDGLRELDRSSRVQAIAMSASVLDVRNLKIRLPADADRAFAVDDVSFAVQPGEIVCLVGESGQASR